MTWRLDCNLTSSFGGIACATNAFLGLWYLYTEPKRLYREHKYKKKWHAYYMPSSKLRCRSTYSKCRGYLWRRRSCSMDSNSLRLSTTFWTFLDICSLCSSTIFMNAFSCSWYVAHNRFLFRSSAVNSWIFLSFSSYKNSEKKKSLK